MNFKLWFESNVEKWRKDIDLIHRSFAFQSWFPPEGVVYLPFQSIANETDYDVKFHFDKDHPYQIHDYKQGLLINKQGRITKIGKVINKDEAEELKRIEAKFAKGQYSDMKYQRELDSTKKYFIELRASYEASPNRIGVNQQSPYMIAISSKPDDLAAMSTNRDWTSCINLDGGSNRDSIWQELKNGGFAAYLCLANDMNIDKPLARMHIRRFDNKKGQSIAIPEETIYGNEMVGFREQVQKWLDSKQGKIKPGHYVRQGGFYSDTFGSSDPDDSKRRQQKDLLHTIYPKSGTNLLKLLNKWHGIFGVNSKVLHVLDKLLNPDLKLNRDTKEQLIKLVKNNFPSYVTKLFLKYPELANKEEIKKLGFYDQNKIFDLKKDDPDYASLKKEIAIQGIMDLDLDDPKLKINSNFHSEYEAAEEVNEVLRKILDVSSQGFSETVIRKIVKLANQIVEKFKPSSIFGSNSLIQLVHALQMAKADTPTVIALYHKLSPYYASINKEDGLGIAIARLGENGKSFLPFLNSILKELKNSKARDKEVFVGANKWENRQNERRIERVNYLIDCIENGTGYSEKYNFY